MIWDQLEKGVDYLPEIMVLNMMKVVNGKAGSYEKEEIKEQNLSVIIQTKLDGISIEELVNMGVTFILLTLQLTGMIAIKII